MSRYIKELTEEQREVYDKIWSASMKHVCGRLSHEKGDSCSRQDCCCWYEGLIVELHAEISRLSVRVKELKREGDQRRSKR